MRILLVNSNNSAIVTEKVLAEARAVAPAGTEVMAVTGTFGARIIGTRAEHAIAEHSTIALVASHAHAADAVIIAVSYDTGLRGARELLGVPVVGMTEAGLLTACMLGGRIGVITFGRRVLPLYRELVESYGLGTRVAGYRVLESAAAYAHGAHPELDAEIVATARDLVDLDGAESIVLTGAVMAGVAPRIQPAVPVPVVDCIGAAMGQARLLAQMKFPKPTAGSYAFPVDRELVAMDDAVVHAFAQSKKKHADEQ